MHVRLRRESFTSDSDANTEYSCAVEDIKIEPPWDQNDVTVLNKSWLPVQSGFPKRKRPFRNGNYFSANCVETFEREEPGTQHEGRRQENNVDREHDSTASPPAVTTVNDGISPDGEKAEEEISEIKAESYPSKKELTIEPPAPRHYYGNCSMELVNRSEGKSNQRLFSPVKKLSVLRKPGEKVVAAFKVRQKLPESSDNLVEIDDSGLGEVNSTESVSDNTRTEASCTSIEGSEASEGVDNDQEDDLHIIEESESLPHTKTGETTEEHAQNYVAEQPIRVKPKRGRPPKYRKGPSQTTDTEVRQKRPVGRPRKYPIKSSTESTPMVHHVQNASVSEESSTENISNSGPCALHVQTENGVLTTEGDGGLTSERSARTEGISQWREETTNKNLNISSQWPERRSVGRPRKPKRPVGRPRKHHPEPRPMSEYGVFSQPTEGSGRVLDEESHALLNDWNPQRPTYQTSGHHDQRGRRGRPSLLSDIDEATKSEIVKHCLKYGTKQTAEVFSEKLGKIVSNQTVWRLMKTYLDGNGSGVTGPRTAKYESEGEPRLTPEQQKQVAKYAIRYGTNEASDYFSAIFGRPIGRNSVGRLKQRYQQLRYWTIENSVCEDDNQRPQGQRKTYKSKYSRELKNQIAEYSIKYGNAAAASHFSRLLNTKVPINTVFALKHAYRKHSQEEHGQVYHRVKTYSSHSSENDSYFTANMDTASSNNYPTSSSNRKRVYNKYTQSQREQMAEYSTKYGINAAVEYFSRMLGTDVPAGTIAFIRARYNKNKVELPVEKEPVMRRRSYSESMTKYNLRNSQSETFYGDDEELSLDGDGAYPVDETTQFISNENWEYETDYGNLGFDYEIESDDDDELSRM